jgi:hypothetical protein
MCGRFTDLYTIPPDGRGAFLQTVADVLASCPVIGPGAVHRAVRETQRQFFDPPDLSHATGAVPLRLSLYSLTDD